MSFNWKRRPEILRDALTSDWILKQGILDLVGLTQPWLGVLSRRVVVQAPLIDTPISSNIWGKLWRMRGRAWDPGKGKIR